MTGRLTTVDEKPDTPSYPLILLPTSFALEKTTKYRPHAAVDDATREIGAAIGVAITGSVLAAAYGHGIDPVAPMIPEPARAAVQDSLAAAIQVAEHAGPQGEQLAELAQNAFLDGLQQASWAVAAILLVGALISAFWPPRRS